MPFGRFPKIGQPGLGVLNTQNQDHNVLGSILGPSVFSKLLSSTVYEPW